MARAKGEETPGIDTLNSLLREIGELQEAREILEELYRSNGPYSRTWNVTNAQQDVIHRYFGFDDSE